MKRHWLVIAVLVSLTLMVGSCELWDSLFGKVEEADVRAAVEDILSGALDTDDTATAEMADTTLTYSSEDSSYVVEIDFSAAPTIVTTITFDEYALPSGEYTVSGSLTGSANQTASPISATASGTLTLTGGKIETLVFDTLTVGTVDDGYWQTATVTGTVTANGTEFDVAGWSLGQIHIANSNAMREFLAPYLG